MRLTLLNLDALFTQNKRQPEQITRWTIATLFIALFFSTNAISRHIDTPCEQLNAPAPEQCTFVLLEDSTNKLILSNKKRAQIRISPFSTFKIPNSLIAFELDIVNDTLAPLKYNPESYPIQSWWPKKWHETTHNITDAFKYSVVPIYQTIAMRIGNTQMQDMLNLLNYGNKNISSGIDNFWLDKSLKISAIEQVKFLQNIHHQAYPLKPTSYHQLAKIMLVESTDDYQIYAKTGGGQIHKDKAQGWYVGYVVKKDATYYFAVNMDGPTFNYVQRKRIEVAKAALVETGVLPQSAMPGY